MSEQSDAVVVAVSEETGAISIALNGELKRDVTRGVLREFLLGQLIPKNTKSDDKKKRSFFKKKEEKNPGGNGDEK